MLQLYYIKSVVLDHHQQHTQTSFGPQSFLFEKYLLRSIVLANLRYYLEFSFFPHFKNNLSQTPVYHNSENVSSPFASLVFDLYHHLDLILTSHMDHCPGLLTDFCFSSFPLLLMKQPEWSFKACFTLKKIHLLSFVVFRMKTYTFYYGLREPSQLASMNLQLCSIALFPGSHWILDSITAPLSLSYARSLLYLGHCISCFLYLESDFIHSLIYLPNFH